MAKFDNGGRPVYRLAKVWVMPMLDQEGGGMAKPYGSQLLRKYPAKFEPPKEESDVLKTFYSTEFEPTDDE